MKKTTLTTAIFTLLYILGTFVIPYFFLTSCWAANYIKNEALCSKDSIMFFVFSVANPLMFFTRNSGDPDSWNHTHFILFYLVNLILFLGIGFLIGWIWERVVAKKAV